MEAFYVVIIILVRMDWEELGETDLGMMTSDDGMCR